MGKMYSTAGTKYFIGGAISDQDDDFDESDFTGSSWLEIKGTTNIGQIGDSATLVSSEQINTRRTKKAKGTYNAGNAALVCDQDLTDPGQLALIAAGKSDANYAFKIEATDAPVVRSAAATITIASPGVVTWTAHALAVGGKVKFSTTGALPTGLVAGTEYFVKTAPTADTFTVSATAAGAAIVTTGTQSGVHTATTVPAPSQRLFIGLVMGTPETFEGANDVHKLQASIEINSNIVVVAAKP